MAKMIEVSNWEDYLEKLNPSQKDYYYSREYYEIFKEKYPNSEIKAFIFTKGNKILIYPCYKIKVTGYDLDSSYYFLEGCYGYNGYITNSNDELFFQEFNDKFTIICNELNIICEFTRFSPFLDNSKLYSKECVYHDRKTVLLDLVQGYDNIWEKEYNSKNRNKIRKAKKSKYNLITDNSRYKEFKEIYDTTMTALKSEEFYYFSESFFKQLSESLNVEYLFVTNDKNIIERGLILIHNGFYSHYHLSGRSSNNDSSLNNFLLDFAIKRSIELDCSLFHLGGGTTNDLEDSLFKYKQNFSKTLKSFEVGFRVHNERIYDLITQTWDYENDNSNKRFLRFKE